MSLLGNDAHANSGSKTQPTKQAIVADTSVLISALFWDGPERSVLRHITDNQTLIVSTHIVDELADFAKHTLPKTPHSLIGLIRKMLDPYVREHGSPSVATRDSHDDPILQLALEHDAIVVTSDKDMLEYQPSTTIVIISTNDYARLFPTINKVY